MALLRQPWCGHVGNKIALVSDGLSATLGNGWCEVNLNSGQTKRRGNTNRLVCGTRVGHCRHQFFVGHTVENEIDGTKIHEARGHRHAMCCHFCDAAPLVSEPHRILRCRNERILKKLNTRSSEIQYRELQSDRCSLRNPRASDICATRPTNLRNGDGTRVKQRQGHLTEFFVVNLSAPDSVYPPLLTTLLTSDMAENIVRTA